MTELSRLLPTALHQLNNNPELRETLVFALWKQAVGEPLARRTKPFRLFKSTLIVSVPSLMWKRELFPLREEILKKLRQAIGQNTVLALEFRVDSEFESDVTPTQTVAACLPEETIQLPLDSIQDNELRQGLAAAAKRYLNRPR